MINLLGRPGKLQEVERFMKQAMLLGPRFLTLVENTELILMKPLSDTPYMMLANMYADEGRWEGIAAVRKSMMGKRIRRKWK